MKKVTSRFQMAFRMLAVMIIILSVPFSLSPVKAVNPSSEQAAPEAQLSNLVYLPFATHSFRSNIWAMSGANPQRTSWVS